MDDKEEISTLISVGADLPPVNPYLDDDNDDDDNISLNPSAGKTKSKSKNSGPSASNTKSIDLDRKEYIAELERPEDIDILY